MKRLFITATIAALALATNAEAKPHKEKKAAREAQRITNTQAAAVVAPTGNRTVVRNYSNGSRYYGRGYNSGYRSGSNVSIGIGIGSPGYYGAGYGYPYGYGGNGYPYRSGYAYSGYARGNVVADVQVRLARRGYYRGVVDGAAGPRTRNAIARYEADHGLYADGRIDRNLLRSLGLS